MSNIITFIYALLIYCAAFQTADTKHGLCAEALCFSVKPYSAARVIFMFNNVITGV